ncbi:MAG: hypothetical protein LQ346_004125 [Caloplaca aetnensis]|nr:MAG: hypothetical protein LQ346_004125 [Caloplaca aetnensis]
MLSHYCWKPLCVAALLAISTAHLIKPPRSIISDRQQVQLNVSFVDASTVSYNGWMISGCGEGKVVTPKLNEILIFLFDMKSHLEAVVADVKLGTRSSHGFPAFFKTSTNIRTVMNKYRQLLDVNPVIVDADRARELGTRTPQPTFHCLKKDDPESADMMAQCQSVPSHYPAIWVLGSESIWLCPKFFTTVSYPPPKQHCPTLGANGKFKPGDGSLMGSNFAYMVFSMVLMYNRDIYESLTKYNRRADMQSAVELSARQSVLHAANYGFYAGGELERNDDFEGTSPLI